MMKCLRLSTFNQTDRHRDFLKNQIMLTEKKKVDFVISNFKDLEAKEILIPNRLFQLRK